MNTRKIQLTSLLLVADFGQCGHNEQIVTILSAVVSFTLNFHKTDILKRKQMARNTSIHMISKADIHVTHRPEEFIPIEEINRETIDTHVRELRNSILRIGNRRVLHVVETDVIDGTMRKYMMDGVHYREVLIAMGLPMFYTYLTVRSREDLIEQLAMLNNSVKRWTIKNYIKSWKFIKPEYIRLEQDTVRYGLTYVGVTMVALANPDRRRMTQIIKTGRFAILNENYQQILEYAADLIDIEELNEIKVYPNRLVSELVRYYGSVTVYDHDIIKERLLQNVDAIRGLASADNELERILSENIFFIEEDGE